MLSAKVRLFVRVLDRQTALCDHQKGRQRNWRAWTAALKEEVDAAQEHTFSLVKKIITTPAVSVEGVAVKLRQAIYWIKIGTEGPEQELVRSALEYVERLAGEAGDDPLVAPM